MDLEEVVAAAQRSQALYKKRKGRVRISEEGLRRLAVHKYQAGVCTPLDNLLYAVWWGPLSNRLPLWLAPNALTLAGSAAAIGSGLLLLCCSPDLEAEVPRWAELLACFLTLFYQTCDALDGMQARRTGAASPLGGLLDHGSDCLCLTSFTLGYCASQRLGFGPSTFFSLCVSWLPWWLAQWEAYHTGVVRTGGELFGITEIELVVALIHLISGLAGADIWLRPVPGMGGAELRHVCTVIQVVVSTALAVLNFHTGISWAREHKVLLPALQRITPMAVLVSVTLVWPCQMPGLHLRLLCVSVSALYSRLASQLVLCHMTHEEYPTPLPALMLLPMLYGMGAIGLLDGLAGTLVLLPYAVWCVASTGRYLADVVEEVATHLGVCLLRLGKRDD